MPYTHKKVGDQYCVYKKDTGKKVGCTDGNEEALRKYLAALHINDSKEMTAPATNKPLKYMLTNIVLFYEEKGYKMKPYPKVTLKEDHENAQNPLGDTAYYEPASNTVVLHVAGRHIKDILRSFSHELVHRHQFNVGIPGYSQVTYQEGERVKDHPVIQKMEKEAYLKGNMMFREWEEEIKFNPVNEDLRDWLKQKWVRVTSSGKIAGPCGSSKNKKNPDRCLPASKAKSLTKGQRAATAQKKKKAGSTGKTYVSNTKKAKVKT